VHGLPRRADLTASAKATAVRRSVAKAEGPHDITMNRMRFCPVGIPYTIVNGVLVIDGGTHTAARPGRPLLGRGFAPK
jgi:hypothetical protein